MSDEPNILNYESPQQPSIRPWVVVGGFGASLGACVFAFIALGLTYPDRPASLLPRLVCFLVVMGFLLGVAVWGFVLRRRRGWRGFGIGMLIGFIIGMIGLVPCGTFYVDGLRSL